MDHLPESGQAGTVSHDVIVTPAMIEAGVLVLLEAPGSGSEHLVERIYQSMALASDRSAPCKSPIARLTR